jgi:hypothetical protein
MLLHTTNDNEMMNYFLKKIKFHLTLHANWIQIWLKSNQFQMDTIEEK